MTAYPEHDIQVTYTNGDKAMSSPLYDKTLELSNAFRREAKALDEAYLKRADMRAVQGGATCEEAALCRTIARQIRELACVVEDGGL